MSGSGSINSFSSRASALNECNNNYYLDKISHHLFALSYFDGIIRAYNMYSKGFMDNDNIGNKAVIPVISLKGDTLFVKGDGTIDNPYSISVPN